MENLNTSIEEKEKELIALKEQAQKELDKQERDLKLITEKKESIESMNVEAERFIAKEKKRGAAYKKFYEALHKIDKNFELVSTKEDRTFKAQVRVYDEDGDYEYKDCETRGVEYVKHNIVYSNPEKAISVKVKWHVQGYYRHSPGKWVAEIHGLGWEIERRNYTRAKTVATKIKEYFEIQQAKKEANDYSDNKLAMAVELVKALNLDAEIEGVTEEKTGRYGSRYTTYENKFVKATFKNGLVLRYEYIGGLEDLEVKEPTIYDKGISEAKLIELLKSL